MLCWVVLANVKLYCIMRNATIHDDGIILRGQWVHRTRSTGKGVARTVMCVTSGLCFYLVEHRIAR